MSYRGAGTLFGPLHLNARTSPGLSAAGEGRIYFDSGTSQFLVSENGGAYGPLTSPASAGGWTDDGTVVRLTTVTDQVGIGTATPAAGYKLEVLGDVTNPAIHLQSGGGGDGIQMESGTGEEIRVVADQNLVLWSGDTIFMGTNPGTSEVRIGDGGGSQSAIFVDNGTEVRITAPLVTINGDNATLGTGSGDVAMQTQNGNIGGDSTRLYITPNLGIILEIGNTIKIDPDGTNNWIYGDDAAVAATPGEPLTLRGGQGNTSGAGGQLRLRGGAGGATGAGANTVIAGGAGGATSGAAGGVSITGGIPVEGNGGSISITASAGVTGTATARAGGSVPIASGLGVSGGANGVITFSLGATENARVSVDGDFCVGATSSFGPKLFAQTTAAGKVALGAYATGASTEALYVQSDSPAIYGALRSVFRIVDGTAGGTGSGAGFIFSGNSGLSGYQPAGIQAYKENASVGNTLASLLFFTNDGAGLNPAEHARLTGPGVFQVGNGTLNSSYVVSTVGHAQFYNNGSCSVSAESYSATSASAGVFTLKRARGTAASPSTVVNGDAVGYVAFQGTVGAGIGALANFANMSTVCDGVPSATSAPGAWIVSTTPASSITPVERLKINSVGTAFLGDGTLATTYGGGGASFIPLLLYNDDASGANQYIRSFNTTVGSGSSIVLDRARGTPATPAAVNSGDNVGGLYFAGASSATTTNYTALIASFASTAAATSGDLRFSTSSSSALVERARITDAGNLGVATTTPTSTLDVNASVGLGNIQTISATTTLDDTDAVVLVDASGGAVTVNLPAATGVTRRSYIIKKTDSSGNAVTVDANGAETIDGTTTRTLVSQFDSLTIVCDGTAWFIV